MRPVAGRSLRDIRATPSPSRGASAGAAVTRVAEELGREAALAWTCRLFGRHSGNLITTRPDDLAGGGYVEIDFGQSLLPSRNRYLEAVMPLWHLRRFFPADGTGGYEEPPVVAAVAAVSPASPRRRGAGAPPSRGAWKRRWGCPAEMDGEAPDPRVTLDHVTAVAAELAAGRMAAAFSELYNRFYQGFWQVGGWQEHLLSDHRRDERRRIHGLLPGAIGSGRNGEWVNR